MVYYRSMDIVYLSTSIYGILWYTMALLGISFLWKSYRHTMELEWEPWEIWW